MSAVAWGIKVLSEQMVSYLMDVDVVGKGREGCEELDER
jgi:hypothetical protein